MKHDPALVFAGSASRRLTSSVGRVLGLEPAAWHLFAEAIRRLEGGLSVSELSAAAVGANVPGKAPWGQAR